MTIMATHFAIVLGAWRLRIRIDLDEPRDADALTDAPVHGAQRAAAWETATRVAARGRG